MDSSQIIVARNCAERATQALPFGERSFFEASRSALEDNARNASELAAFLDPTSPDAADAIQIYKSFADQNLAHIERQNARAERLESDPVMVKELRDQALALIVEVPISQYLSSIRPGILLWRDGNNYYGPCPFAGHNFDQDSFRIHGDDFGWCERCGGGNLFRLIGMVEALPSPYQQIRRAAEIAGLDLPDRSPRIVPPDHLYRGTGTRERFSEIRIVAGRVAR